MSDQQQSLPGDFEPDQKRYREASVPHESPKAAEEAINAFIDEVCELRVKHRIKDVLIVYNVALLEADGAETVGAGVAGFGTQSLFESMAATAYGIERAKREASIRRMLAGSLDEVPK